MISIYDVICTGERGITALLYKLLFAQITICYYVSGDVLECGEEGASRYPGRYEKEIVPSRRTV